MLKRCITATLATVVLLATIFMMSPSRLAARPPVTLTQQTVASCIQHLATAMDPHHLTLAEARACAPGAPEFSKDALPKTYPGAIFIVIVSSNQATINVNTPSRGASHLLNTSASLLAPATCWNDWKSDTTHFFDALDWGSITGWGYGNHCGYSNFPNDPNVQPYCACSGHSITVGHYDNNYGQANFGQNFAADWANIVFNFPIGSETWLCREYIDPNATIWGVCY